MALEQSTLRPLLSADASAVNRSVLYWAYFKARLLEDASVRTRFTGEANEGEDGTDNRRKRERLALLRCDEVLTRDQFKEALEDIAPPSKFGPRVCRGAGPAPRRRRRCALAPGLC